MFKLITHNIHKYEEMKKIIPELEMIKMEYIEIQSDSLEEVVNFVVEHLSSRIEGNFIIDDSGLFIQSLNGFPGVYSAYVFKTLGNDGILKLMKGTENRRALFKTVIGIRFNGVNYKLIGICQGEITEEKKGKNGFGYDPIFIPDGHDHTFGEMTTEEKNRISHRGKAMRKLAGFMERFGI